MRRGGRRRRWIHRDDAAVSCPGGRWGRRRLRVSQCWAMLRAEDLYTALLADNAAAVAPGARGAMVFTLGDREVTASWEIRQNAVWRRGRVFLCCPQCALRCTRLYMPTEDCWLRCRSCWGLTYTSRQQNYKDTLLGGLGALALSHRTFTLLNTQAERERRAERAAERYKMRRPFLEAHRGKTRRDRGIPCA